MINLILKRDPFIEKVSIKNLSFQDNYILIKLTTEKVLKVPLDYTQRLKDSKIEDLKQYKIIGDGIGIHFVDIDEDLSLENLLRNFDVVININ